MPFKSKAQRRKFYAMANRGEISEKTVKHWEDATHGKKLPEHVKKAFDAVALPPTPTLPSPAPLAPVVAVAAAPTIAKLKAQAIYKISEDVASQLKHHDDPDSEFHPGQLAKGIEVEREHSESLPVRKAITKGHLAEFDRYYTALDKMEEKLKEGKTAAYGLGVKVARFWVAPAIGAGIGTLTDSENRLRGALRGGAIGAGVSVGAHLGGRAAGRLLVNDKTEAGIEQAYRALRAAREAGVLPPPGTLQTVLKPGAGILGGRLAGGVAGGLGVSYLDKKLEPYSKIR